jgi:hypothetical protein
LLWPIAKKTDSEIISGIDGHSKIRQISFFPFYAILLQKLSLEHRDEYSGLLLSAFESVEANILILNLLPDWQIWILLLGCIYDSLDTVQKIFTCTFDQPSFYRNLSYFLPFHFVGLLDLNSFLTGLMKMCCENHSSVHFSLFFRIHVKADFRFSA